MACPKCAQRHLVAIAVTIAGDRVEMHSCSDCGNRWWERDGHPVALPTVLELATTRN